ncbi:YEATS domain-containing protein 2 [Melanaphis sacchari]|uniref:YEATS domain-containing protein 2 n=1 Tax=Melanaphis sacchari TaxID=742174 RepID=A0A2H8TSA5_9HEMI|nr:YEATS domain-containing protein 2 [Melanaphis sacchari]XP_025208974.1 YEATS domain-containing protein 2 [Melanaphis sacchari]XP_025208975.1 YEATS domain-containing protein 2 [Melanaphis sacchari]
MNSNEQTLRTITVAQTSQVVEDVKADLDNEITKTKKTLDQIDQNIFTCINDLKKLRRSVIISHFANMKNNIDGNKNSQRDALLKNLERENEIKDLGEFMAHLNNASTQVKSEPMSNIEELNKIVLQNTLLSESFIPKTGLIDLTFIIGNTVKISDSENEMKYKWTVYVRNAEEGVDNLIYIDKVTYFLHESYEPNHVVDVFKKPFSLTRHGWGEFVIRLRLFFKGNMKVQTDVYHKLCLDKEITAGIPMVAKEQTVKFNLLLHI